MEWIDTKMSPDDISSPFGHGTMILYCIRSMMNSTTAFYIGMTFSKTTCGTQRDVQPVLSISVLVTSCVCARGSMASPSVRTLWPYTLHFVNCNFENKRSESCAESQLPRLRSEGHWRWYSEKKKSSEQNNAQECTKQRHTHRWIVISISRRNSALFRRRCDDFSMGY